jgi:predicted metal-dependent phosphoesterase TrpH
VKVYKEICTNDPGVPVILAEEILTSEGEIIGLFLQKEIPAFMSADETLDCIRDQGALSIVPHPFCSFRSSVIRPDVLDRIIDRVDIIEGFNGRAVHLRDNDRARSYAARCHLPISAGSDAHSPEELGKTYVTLTPFSSPEELVREIRHAAIHYHRAPPPPHPMNRILPGTSASEIIS